MSRHLHYHNSMDNSSAWKYLARKPKSAYKQLFVKDRWVAARTLYGQSLGEDARTPPPSLPRITHFRWRLCWKRLRTASQILPRFKKTTHESKP